MQLYQYWEVVERNGKFYVQHLHYEESYCFDTYEFAQVQCNFCNRVDRIKYVATFTWPLEYTESKFCNETSYRFYWTINRNPGFQVFVNEKPSLFVRFFLKHLLGIEYFPA